MSKTWKCAIGVMMLATIVAVTAWPLGRRIMGQVLGLFAFVDVPLALLFLALAIVTSTDSHERQPRLPIEIIHVDAGDAHKSFDDLTEEEIVAAMERLGIKRGTENEAT